MRAAAAVPGVARLRPGRGPATTVRADGTVDVELHIVVDARHRAAAVGAAVQDAVVAALDTTGRAAHAVRVHIVEITVE